MQAYYEVREKEEETRNGKQRWGMQSGRERPQGTGRNTAQVLHGKEPN